MSYLHRIESTYGRLVPKPQVEGYNDEDDVYDEVVPIQDQIENIRTKISLKEKYNRVLTENFEESRQGASSILQDLFIETRNLRFHLMGAIKSEETSVQHALRAHRIFQLAMTERVVTRAIPWLDDKLYDKIRNLNNFLYKLGEKRAILEESEQMVMMIEKWPRPGTLPWEITALEEFERMEYKIDNIRIKCETTSILHAKYYNIKFLLREEQGKYQPILHGLDHQLRSHKQELQSLQRMLDEAIYFRAESSRNLILTEKEASENRKQRRKQLAKMKKAVDKILLESNVGTPSTVTKTFDYTKFEDKVLTSHLLEELKHKKEIVGQYWDRARHLVETMRVSDLTQIPARLKTVTELGIRLKTELDAKEAFRDLLLKQKNQLILILCHFRYTGQSKEAAYKKKVSDFKDSLAMVKIHEAEARKRFQRYGNISIGLRLSIIAILQRLDPTKRHGNVISGDLKNGTKRVYSKIKKLIKKVDTFKELFRDRVPERNYDQFVKQPQIQSRLVRIGSPIEVDESEDEDNMPDMKVPSRQDIKNKSLRVIHQAIIRRGLR